MLGEYLKIAFTNLRRRKLRSWLTVIGIVIGISAIVSLTLIAQGTENAVNQAFEEFGTDVILVQGGAAFGPPTPGEYGLKDRDINFFESFGETDIVIPYVYDTQEVEYKSEKKYPIVYAIDTEFWDEFLGRSNFEVERGRNFQDGETGSVIVGWKLNQNYFEKKVDLKSRIKIGGKTFKVIGIYERIGNDADDTSIAMSIDDARKVFAPEGKVTGAQIIVKEGVDIEEFAKELAEDYEDYRGDKNFILSTSTAILEQINNILGIIRYVVVGIAGIALIVGSVGIANTMYMSVIERTKEIGIMKSIGATNNAILTIFLIEAAFFGIVGGIIGCIIGIGLALAAKLAIEMFAPGLPFLIIIDPFVIGGALFFSVIAGLLSGILPARNASKLKPVDALRYE
jgi:putative ABC transport system permease protein